MIRKLLTTTAIAALLATGALAQNAAAPADPGASELLQKGYDIIDTDGLASKLLGFPVYSSQANDAEHFGEINDLVVGQDGQVSAVLIGVGGFLGVGEKNVAVAYEDLQWVTAEDQSERIVLATTKEALDAAPGVEMVEDNAVNTAAMQPAEAPVDATRTGTVTTTEPMANTNDAVAPMDPFNPAAATAVDFATLTVDDLKGTNVYGPDNQHIGAISDFALGEDGKTVDAVIVDFGGFLGIGTKPVAIAYDKLNFYADEAGNRSLVLSVTREQMEAAPAFNRDTYAAERDSQRIVLDGTAT